VKNPVRTNDVRWREYGAFSMEKAIWAIHHGFFTGRG